MDAKNVIAMKTHAPYADKSRRHRSKYVCTCKETSTIYALVHKCLHKKLNKAQAKKQRLNFSFSCALLRYQQLHKKLNKVHNANKETDPDRHKILKTILMEF